MPKITPVDWRILVRVFEFTGFQHDRTKGSHYVMTKAGVIRPVVIPMYDEVGLDIILSNLRSAGISRDDYFDLLEKARS